MKRFKGLSALFLALILAFSLSAPAFAATGNNTITSIKYNAEPFTITPYTYTAMMAMARALRHIPATLSLLTLTIPYWRTCRLR